MSAGSNRLTTEKLDFEYWASLAERDPQGFEQSREQLIDEFIASAPEHTQTRLRGLQWRIDRTRERSHSPLGSCVAISRMMWETYERLNTVLKQLTQPDACSPVEPATRADVLTFPTRTRTLATESSPNS